MTQTFLSETGATRIEACFAEIERAAIAGERCPQNGTYNIRSAYVMALADIGRIRVEISGHNYRCVVILTGEHAGKATMADPSGHRVWMVIGRERVVNRRVVRQQPSRPIPLTRFVAPFPCGELPRRHMRDHLKRRVSA